ncbi:MAG: hypothetical protein HOY79_34240 [Streptomyces sp.]|nr:hypothetical protein [Streptomyces sp.]NUS11381.1 hypothetical protein [Streptomyces sp.]NUS23478.1 hypothetical protein [Streptomyces sp.]
MPSHKPTAGEVIRAAISHLRTGGPARPDLADAVEAMAEQRFRGWAGAEGTTVKFKADRELLSGVGAGRVQKVAEEGCRRFVAGQLVPARTVRGAAGQKTSTSVRVDDDLLARVTARCTQLSADLGWTVKPVNVLVAAFEEDVAARE